MLKVKINDEWIEEVYEVREEPEGDYTAWFGDREQHRYKNGQIQDIKRVEDEPEEIEEIDPDCADDMDVRYTIVELTKAVNKLLKTI